MGGDHLRALLRAEPFRPFTMGLVGKIQVRVPRPDWAMISPGGDTMVVYETTRSAHTFVNTAHVASITFDPPPPVPDAIVGE